MKPKKSKVKMTDTDAAPKYELIDEDKKIVDDVTCRRIRALRTFARKGEVIKAGTVGGYIQGVLNLSQHDTCWVYDDACVIGSSLIKDDAVVMHNACVKGNVTMSDRSVVGQNVVISGNVRFTEYGCAFADAKISGNVIVGGNTCVSDDAYVSGNIVLDGRTTVKQNARITGTTCIIHSSIIYGSPTIEVNNGTLMDCTITGGNIKLNGFRMRGASVGKSANISETYDYFIVCPLWHNAMTTFYRSTQGGFRVAVGQVCDFTPEQFLESVKAIGDDSLMKECLAVLEFVKLHLRIPT
jgi:carbonic anhydrase/acetyltransferase-like protein (isoleucine patch superfamily)